MVRSDDHISCFFSFVLEALNGYFSFLTKVGDLLCPTSPSHRSEDSKRQLRQKKKSNSCM